VLVVLAMIISGLAGLGTVVVGVVVTGLVVAGVVVFVVVAASLLQPTAKEINPTNSTTASRATNALLMFRVFIGFLLLLNKNVLSWSERLFSFQAIDFTYPKACLWYLRSALYHSLYYMHYNKSIIILATRPG
jgi:hypothetical protein